MQLTEIEARGVKQAGVDALRRGDMSKAREQFDRAVAAGHGDALVWLGLAAACRSLQDKSAMIDALDKVLTLEPRNLRALIMKADHLAELGDVPSSLAFYRAALKSAATAGRVPPDLANELRRADETCERFAAAYEAYLRKRLAEAGFDSASSSPRFARSVDILHAKREVYLQQPRHFYFPELPQIQFYDRALFPWLDAVEAATAGIRSEAEAVLADSASFAPYVTSGPKERPRGDDHGMRDNPDWSAFFMVRDGMRVPENADRCPKTLKALEKAPLSQAKGRMPSILLSLLRPGARIPPHTGVVNTRLICHLPVIVPGKCALRVGNETREWVEGKAWVFDDSMQHEAWNESDKPRVILLFDIWRPELGAEERKLVTALLEAIDEHGAAGAKWDI